MRETVNGYLDTGCYSLDFLSRRTVSFKPILWLWKSHKIIIVNVFCLYF